MYYLGMDVHSKSTAWCLLDAGGAMVKEGTVETTNVAPEALVNELASRDQLVAGQEVGMIRYFVHDVLSAAGTKILSFNSAQLRMIVAPPLH